MENDKRKEREEKEKEKERDDENGTNKKPRLDLPVVSTPTLEVNNTASSSTSPFPFNSPKEEILDDRLAALSHEQLELLITRLARTDPTMEEKIMRHIERLEHSMSMYSPRRSEFTPGRAGLSPFMGMGMGVSPRSPLAMRMMFGGDLGFEENEEVNVKAIRRKIRSAFQKLKDPRSGGKKRRRGDDGEPQKYKLAADSIRKELKKAKDFVLLRSDGKRALDVMDAITDEYINTGSEVGEENVEQYDDVLQEIAQDWVDIFLADALNELPNEERMDWVNKLFVWDKSPDEAEGTFSAARAAAKLGWKDVHLQQVLAGEHIGKFKEPEALSIVRCNILERDRKLEQALHLSKAVELHHFTARYLIKLGRMEEALAAARVIEDPAKVYSIAQVARSMDVKIAFALAIQSIALPFEWNAANNERALWLCDLAISQSMVDQLVNEVDNNIKHKTVQFEIAKILKDKTAFKPALSLAAIVLKPWPIKPEDPTKPAVPLNQQQLLLQQREEIARAIPRTVIKWMWEVSYEMVVIDVGTRQDIEQVLASILEDVRDVDQLLSLARDMHTRQEYDQAIRVCEHCVQLSIAAIDKDLNDQASALKEYFEAILKKVQPQPQLTRLIGYPNNLDRNAIQAVNQILTSAFDSKIEPDPWAPQPVIKVIRPFSPLSAELIEEKLTWCISLLKDPAQLTQIANILRTRKEYPLVPKTGRRVQERLRELDSERVEKEKWMAAMTTLQQEQQELFAKRKALPDDKLEELNGYLFQKELQRIVPHYKQYNETQLDNLQLAIAQLMINSAIDNAVGIEAQTENMDIGDTATDIVMPAAMEFIVDNTFLLNPNHRMQLLSDLQTRLGQYFPITHILLKISPMILDYIVQKREEFVARQKIAIPLSILQNEQAQILQEFTLKKRKDNALAPNKQEKLDNLTIALSTLPPTKYYDFVSTTIFENSEHQIASRMITIAVATRQQLNEALWMSDEDIDNVLVTAIKYTHDPSHISNFMTIIKNSTSIRSGDQLYDFNHGYDLVTQLGQKILITLQELNEARPARFEFEFEKKELQREGNELEIQKKTLSPEQQARLEELEEQYQVERAIEPKYIFDTPTKNEKMKSTTCQTMLRSTIDNAKRFQNRIASDPEAFTVEMIAQGNEERKKQLSTVVDICEQFLHDPASLLELGKNLSDNSEITYVIRYVQRVIALVEKLETDRRERSVWEQELQGLEEEDADLKSKRKTLEPEDIERMNVLRKQKAKLQLLPPYQTQSWQDHDELNLSAVQLALSALFNLRTRLDSLVASEAEDIDLASILKQREEIAAQVNWVIDQVVGKHISNPSSLIRIGKTLFSSNEYDRVLPMAMLAYTRIIDIQKERLERYKVKHWIKLLTKEQSTLEISKKDLAPAQQKQLDKFNEQEEAFEPLPHYAKVKFETLDNNINDAGRLVLNSAVQALRIINGHIAAAPPDSPPILQKEKQAAKKRVDEAVEFVVNKIGSPSFLLSLANEMAQSEEYEILLPIALRCQLRIAEINTEYEKRLDRERQCQRLKTLEAELIHNRKALDDEQKQLLRDLMHEEMVNNDILCSYMNIDPDRNDSTSQQAGWKRIEALLQMKEDTIEKMTTIDNASDEDIEKEKRKYYDRLETIIDESIEYIKNPRNLSSIVTNLNRRLEYSYVIKIGIHCQSRIEALIRQNERRQELAVKLADLQQQLIVAPSDAVKTEIEKVTLEQETLPIQYEQTHSLNNQNLNLASIMIEAAKVEERKDVLRDQAVLRFNISPTIPLFEQVKVLTEPDEWPNVKKGLLEQILKPEPTPDPSQPFSFHQPSIDPRAKMELLLNEGMWKQAIPLFPEPPAGSLDMLERLFLDVEKNSPDDLDTLLPVVEKYVAYNYQAFSFRNAGLDRLLDQVQKRNPDFVYGLFSRAAEKMLTNIVPKQYAEFVAFLQIFQKRLEDLGRDDDFEAYMADLTKQHKGKRKLMQLITNAGLK